MNRGPVTQQSSAPDYIKRVLDALQNVREADVLAFVDVLVDARIRDKKVFVIGNGGSAMTASHMATDLGVGSQRFGAGVRVVSLSENSGALTAIGNDASFEDVFSDQVQLLAEEGDVLIAISASGNSPNLVKAVMMARREKLTVVSLTGFSGGRLKELADVAVHVETENGDYGPAEDAHLVVNHMVTELLRLRVGTASDISGLHG